MKKGFKFLFSGELFFVLFLFSGAFKESITFITFDLAAVFLALSLISFLGIMIKQRSFKRYIILPLVYYLAIFVTLIVSYLFTPSEVYATEKLLKFIFLTSPAFLLPLFLIRGKESLNRFLVSIALLSFVLSMVSLPMIFQRGSSLGFVGFNDGNYQGLARLNGIGLVIILFLYFLGDFTKKTKIIALSGAIVVAFSLISTGSRMPLIAFGFILLVYIYSSFRVKDGILYMRKGVKFLLPSLAIISLPLIYLYRAGYFDAVVYRFEVLLSSGGGASVEERFDRLQVAIDMWANNPFVGVGIGSFPLFYLGTDIRDYPHNIFFEFLAEWGIVGLTIFILFLLSAFYRAFIVYKRRNGTMESIHITLILLFSYTFLNALVSGDINDNRILFTIMSLLFISPYLKGRIKRENLEESSLKELASNMDVIKVG